MDLASRAHELGLIEYMGKAEDKRHKSSVPKSIEMSIRTTRPIVENT